MPEIDHPVYAIIVAAGTGTRFDDPSGPRKQYRELGGRPLVLWALDAFLGHPRVARTVLVLPPSDAAAPPVWLRDLPVIVAAGGAERGESVRNGLLALDGCPDGIALVHDGARPFANRALIDRVIAAADGTGVIPRVPVTDTVKEVDADGFVIGTLDRSRYWRVQTPQAFPLHLLRMSHDRARAEGYSATDDAALFERYGIPVRTVAGDEENIKVTTKLDLRFAAMLAQRLPPTTRG